MHTSRLPIGRWSKHSYWDNATHLIHQTAHQPCLLDARGNSRLHKNRYLTSGGVRAHRPLRHRNLPWVAHQTLPGNTRASRWGLRAHRRAVCAQTASVRSLGARLGAWSFTATMPHKSAPGPTPAPRTYHTQDGIRTAATRNCKWWRKCVAVPSSLNIDQRRVRADSIFRGGCPERL